MVRMVYRVHFFKCAFHVLFLLCNWIKEKDAHFSEMLKTSVLSVLNYDI